MGMVLIDPQEPHKSHSTNSKAVVYEVRACGWRCHSLPADTLADHSVRPSSFIEVP